jgi:SOUL heme-binding protein
MHIPLKTYLESIPGFFGIRLEEEPEFEVVQPDSEDGFEIRRYVSTLQAQTLVEISDRDEAANEGFRRLANYIFGGNYTDKQISMTTPVLQTRSTAQKQGWLISFILPKEISVSEAPAPEDDRVKITTVAPKTLAVLRFTGTMTNELMAEKDAELRELLSKSGNPPQSETLWAQYDQPMSIPVLKRNEVMIEIDAKVDLAN